MAAEIGRRADLPVYVHFRPALGPARKRHQRRRRRYDSGARDPLLRRATCWRIRSRAIPAVFVNREGEVHPVIQAALDRGLKVDVGHGSHFSYRLARKALAAGIVPTTLGADIHGYNTHVPAPAGTPGSARGRLRTIRSRGRQNLAWSRR
jgi:dihydroorotase